MKIPDLFGLKHPAYSPAIALAFVIVSIAPIGARLEAAQVAVVMKDGSGYRFAAAEEVSVNGKTKVRLLPAESPPASGASASSPAPRTVQPKEADRLPPTALAQLTLLRKSEDGVVYAFDAGSRKWSAVVPEGVQSKTPEALAAIWARAQLAYVVDRKAKNGAAVFYDQLFAVVSGETASGALSEFDQPGAVDRARHGHRRLV